MFRTVGCNLDYQLTSEVCETEAMAKKHNLAEDDVAIIIRMVKSSSSFNVEELLFSDLTIKCKDLELPVHKFILCRKSYCHARQHILHLYDQTKTPAYVFYRKKSSLQNDAVFRFQRKRK